MINTNELFEEYLKKPEVVKLKLVTEAAKELIDYIQQPNASSFDILDYLTKPDYSEICDWLGWPDLQDGGLFEQCIDMACNTILVIYGYKPQHFIKKEEK